jgi:hypothetical protein
LTGTSETVKLFEAELGEGLSVWSTCFSHTESIHFFDRLPGLKREHPKESSFLTDRFAQTTESFVVNFPVLDVEKPSFLTRVKVIGPALDRFKKKDNISINQLSPCTLTITFGPFQVQGNYIFPVDGANTRLRVSARTRMDRNHRSLCSSHSKRILHFNTVSRCSVSLGPGLQYLSSIRKLPPITKTRLPPRQQRSV